MIDRRLDTLPRYFWVRQLTAQCDSHELNAASSQHVPLHGSLGLSAFSSTTHSAINFLLTSVLDGLGLSDHIFLVSNIQKV